MKSLPIKEFGDPVLRQPARELTRQEIRSKDIKELISNMHQTLLEKKLGVALAAPQVGEAIALVVVAIQPTKHRPDVEHFELVMANPQLLETRGRKTQIWEGCISGGKASAGLFAKVPRYKTVTVRYINVAGETITEEFKDLQAQIMQHEIDHINGVLFVDRVKDTKTFVTYKQYLKIRKAERTP